MDSIKKFLFVDFDGVLRPYHYTALCEQLWQKNRFCKTKDEYGYYFAPYSIDALRYILAVTGANMVFSTDWRKNGYAIIKELWSQRGYPFPERILGITPITDHQNRGAEITAWLKENINPARHRYSYAILDDRADMGSKHDKRHVLIDKKIGLTMNEAMEAIEYLQTEVVKDPHE